MLYGPFLTDSFDQTNVVRYNNRYEYQIKSGIVDSASGTIWRLKSGSLPPNSTLSSTGLITVNFSTNMLPFTREQFVNAGAPAIPSLSQAAWDVWLKSFLASRQPQDYEFVLELSDTVNPVQLGHTFRIIHLRPPVSVKFDMSDYDRGLFDQTALGTSWFTQNQNYITVDPAQDYYLFMSTDPDGVVWSTDSDLGQVINGSISQLAFEASASSGKPLYYKVKPFSISRLPQGTKLLEQGYLSGRFSFRCYQDDTANLPVDDIYDFTLRVGTLGFRFYSEKSFRLKVRRFNLKPYDTVWLNAFSPLDERLELQSILNNKTLVPDSSVYRLHDPWWGRVQNFRILMAPAMNLTSLAQYENAMLTNHYNKTLLFDQLQIGYSLDTNLKTIYEVVYLTLRDNLLGRDSATGAFKALPNTIDLRPFIVNYHRAGNQTFYELTPNGLENMRSILRQYVGIYNPGIAPDWMLSFQPDENEPGVFTAPIGFLPVIVLVYCNPGQGRLVHYRLNSINFNNFRFESDRFNLESRLSDQYNRLTNRYRAGSKASFDGDLTRFDYDTTRIVDNMEYAADPTDRDKYLIFPKFREFK